MVDEGITIPVDFIIAELKSPAYEVRLNCVNKIMFVAAALGSKVFKKNLYFFFDAVEDDVSLTAILIEKLPGLLAHIGGTSQTAFLISILSKFLSDLNKEIRIRAVESTNSLFRYCNYKEMFNIFVPILTKLYETNSVSAKLSCIEMVLNFYLRGNPFIRIVIRSMVGRLSDNTSSLIKVKVCGVLKDLFKIVPKDSIYLEMLPLFLRLHNDNELVVRAACLEIMPSLSLRISVEHKIIYLLPIVENSMKDESVVIRKIMLDRFNLMFNMFRDYKLRYSLLSLYVNAMDDSDFEVAKKAIGNLEDIISSILPSNKFQACNELLKPNIIKLAKSNFPDDETVAILASTACIVSAELSEEIILEEMLPIFSSFLKNPSCKVRASFVGSLHLIHKVMTRNALKEHIEPPLKKTSCDTKWTVRLAAVTYLYNLSILLGFDYFETNFISVFMSFITDQVASVRETTVECLIKLIKRFGYQSQVSIIPVVVSHTKNPHYLIRIACVKLLTSLIPMCTKEVVIETILPTIIKSATDPVPNVRFNTAKAFISIIPQLELKFIEYFVRPSLAELLEDKDDDVQYFANEALNSIKLYFKEEEEKENEDN